MAGDMIIRNGTVLLSDGHPEKCDLSVRGGRIEALGRSWQSAGTEIDATGLTVLPGIIDLHTHGLADVSAGDGSLLELAEVEARHGATTFYPTLFAPPNDVADQMRRHLSETNDLALTPQVGGFRLESPYLARTGAGISKDLAPISQDLTDRLLRAGGGHISIWDISPELDCAPSLIRRLTADGVVCSLAHTQATIDQAREAVDAGASLVTHLFCTFVLPEMTEPGAYPAGLVDYLLVEDRVTCEIIGDGTHVDPLLVEKAFRCKGSSGLAFVTDSNRGAGLPPADYSLGEWGNVRVAGPNDGLRLVDRDMILAGSALTPIDALRNVVKLFGKDMAVASEVCSRTPARLMRLNKGEIAPGRDADLILLDADRNLVHTICRGLTVWSA